MSKGIARTLALAALAFIVEKESEIDALAAEVEAKRKELDKLMISLKQVRLEGDNYEVIRFPSTGYEIDDKALEKVLQRANVETFDLLMPRSPAAKEVRKVIDGKALPKLRKPIRACCTKHMEWKLRVQKAKRKAQAVISDAACAAS